MNIKHAIIKRKVLEMEDLPTLSVSAMHILKLINDPNAPQAKVINAIHRDPSICTGILKLINSGLYGVRTQVNSIKQAVVLLGHFIGFLFPRTLIAWNGMPIRLLILEVTALIFSLSALLGVILLIYRRITNKRVRILTSKADILVYIVIFIQVVTGVWIALFFRWGSSWYASTMVPYLKSILFFSPDIAALVQMPFMVKVHVLSAFTLVGLIPFTRFSHFMVFPISYYWRDPQLVFWNRNNKTIRSSKRISPGVKSKNN